jgi:hypothetical protein
LGDDSEQTQHDLTGIYNCREHRKDVSLWFTISLFLNLALTATLAITVFKVIEMAGAMNYLIELTLKLVDKKDLWNN